jgi:hypothetical protein
VLTELRNVKNHSLAMQVIRGQLEAVKDVAKSIIDQEHRQSLLVGGQSAPSGPLIPLTSTRRAQGSAPKLRAARALPPKHLR